MAIEEIEDHVVNKISAFAQKQIRLEQRVKALEDQLKEAKKQLAQVSEVDIPEVMEEAGVQSIMLIDGSKVKVKPIFIANIKKENEAEAFEWLIKHDLGPIIKRSFTLEFGKGESELAEEAERILRLNGFEDYKSKESVHPQTLRKTMRELMEDGELRVPMELFGIHELRKTEIER